MVIYDNAHIIIMQRRRVRFAMDVLALGPAGAQRRVKYTPLRRSYTSFKNKRR